MAPAAMTSRNASEKRGAMRRDAARGQGKDGAENHGEEKDANHHGEAEARWAW